MTKNDALKAIDSIGNFIGPYFTEEKIRPDARIFAREVLEQTLKIRDVSNIATTNMGAVILSAEGIDFILDDGYMATVKGYGGQFEDIDFESFESIYSEISADDAAYRMDELITAAQKAKAESLSRFFIEKDDE